MELSPFDVTNALEDPELEIVGIGRRLIASMQDDPRLRDQNYRFRCLSGRQIQGEMNFGLADCMALMYSQGESLDELRAKFARNTGRAEPLRVREVRPLKLKYRDFNTLPFHIPYLIPESIKIFTFSELIWDRNYMSTPPLAAATRQYMKNLEINQPLLVLKLAMQGRLVSFIRSKNACIRDKLEYMDPLEVSHEACLGPMWGEDRGKYWDTEDQELLLAAVQCLILGVRFEDQLRLMLRQPLPEPAEVYHEDARRWEEFVQREKLWESSVIHSQETFLPLKDLRVLRKCAQEAFVEGFRDPPEGYECSWFYNDDEEADAADEAADAGNTSPAADAGSLCPQGCSG